MFIDRLCPLCVCMCVSLRKLSWHSIFLKNRVPFLPRLIGGEEVTVITGRLNTFLLTV